MRKDIDKIVVLTPAEDSACRLGHPYTFAEKARIVGGLWRSTVGVATRNAINKPWRLVRRLGTFGVEETSFLYKKAPPNMGVTRFDKKLPPMLKPPLPPDEAKARAAAKNLTDTRRAVAVWRRKSALAKTKLKQYERRLRRLEKNA
jgi:hypothetical protein